MSKCEICELISNENDEISVAAHICEERLSFAQELPLNEVGYNSLVSLRDAIDELLKNAR